MKPVFDIATKAKNSPNGISIKRLVSAAATTNPTLVKASGGRVFKIIGQNADTTAKYIKLYNKATAPTVGTDTPVMTIPVAGSAMFDIDFGEIGLYFSTGIGFGITDANADADTTALTAGDILGMSVLYC